MNTTVPMRFGLVGFGAWGHHHARSIAGEPTAALAAIAARSDESAAAARAEFPAAALFRDWRGLIADPAVEVVAIATPNHLHAEVALAALAAGKHVLVEKPMATTLADCDRLVAAAERGPGLLSVGFECRLSPQWGRIRALIDEGRIGRPQHVHVALFRHPYRPGAAGWRHDRARVGSWILEEPVHFFDLALWYLEAAGGPVSLRALSAGESGMEPVLSVIMRFPDGSTAAINQILSGFGHLQTVEVTGSAGAVRATWAAATARSTTPDCTLTLLAGSQGTPESLPVERSGEVFELAAQVKANVAAFRRGEAFVSARAGRAAVALCLAAEQSARENGREIMIERS
jgi:myo-inositol 2-dehydrogenase/D-chiro-inositol 1-dehydrogenase